MFQFHLLGSVEVSVMQSLQMPKSLTDSLMLLGGQTPCVVHLTREIRGPGSSLLLPGDCSSQ